MAAEHAAPQPGAAALYATRELLPAAARSRFALPALDVVAPGGLDKLCSYFGVADGELLEHSSRGEAQVE